MTSSENTGQQTATCYPRADPVHFHKASDRHSCPHSAISLPFWSLCVYFFSESQPSSVHSFLKGKGSKFYSFCTSTCLLIKIKLYLGRNEIYQLQFGSEVSPKCPCVKISVPREALLQVEGSKTFKKQDLVGNPQVLESTPLRGKVEVKSLLSLLCSVARR